MPVYEYECPDCDEIVERVFGIEDFPQFLACGNCPGLAEKIISQIQNVKPGWEPYYDEHLDAMITCRGQRRSLMKQQGLEDRPLDPTVKRLRIEKREHKKREEMKYGR